MNQPIIELSQDVSDYKRINVDTLTLVNAASSGALSGQKAEPGIALQFSVDGKILRVPLLSPLEIAREELDEAAIEARTAEILRTTCIGTVAKKNKALYLDPQSPHFDATAKRLVTMAKVAAGNFARDMEALVKLYDSFTTSTGGALPQATAFLLQAAFGNIPLLTAYRTARKLPENTTPMLTDKAREILTRFKVASDSIPAYDPSRQGIALPAGPAALRAAYQMETHAAEVQVITKALANAAQAGIIAPIAADREFREYLAAVVDYARKSQAMAPAAAPSQAAGLHN